MYLIAQTIIVISFFLCLALAGIAVSKNIAMQFATRLPLIFERTNLIFFTALFACLIILLAALVKCDYSLAYSAFRTDNSLPVFYRIAALWSGAEGSLLFWAWGATLSAVIFQHTPAYKALPEATTIFFWAFYWLVMGFFMFQPAILSSPFTTLNIPPTNGAGMSPMLQHPGMIMHPPMLLLGYALLIVPACLAFARLLSGPAFISETPVFQTFLLLAWVFITGGIGLGMWWAFTESNWGGYWTWDAVENSSLLPWVAVTAALHASGLENKQKAFFRLANLAIIFCLIASLFATYIVRSGIVNSKHAFNLNSSSLAILLFILVITIIALICAKSYKQKNKTLAPPFSQEGFILLNICLLGGLAIVIKLGILWPLISSTWGQSQILTASFYNNTCPPLAIALLLSSILALCWDKHGKFKVRLAILPLIAALLITMLFIWFGWQKLIPLAASAFAVALIFTIPFTDDASPLSVRLCRYMAQVGLGLAILGIACSSGYKEDWILTLEKDRPIQIDEQTLTYAGLELGSAQNYKFAELNIKLNNESENNIILERRAYPAFDNLISAPTVFYGPPLNRLAFVFSSLNQDNSAVIRVTKSPLTALIWLGFSLMCLCPLPLVLLRGKHVAAH